MSIVNIWMMSISMLGSPQCTGVGISWKAANNQGWTKELPKTLHHSVGKFQI